jgi:hypothetical protein
MHRSGEGVLNADFAQSIRAECSRVLAQHHRVGAGAGAQDADLALHAENSGGAAGVHAQRVGGGDRLVGTELRAVGGAAADRWCRSRR